MMRLKAKNEELERIVQERTKEIAHQKEIIEEKHEEITDSINYAQRIQAAMMAAEHYWTNIGKDQFIYFKPRDVVSGDFYWAFDNEKVSIWAAADCTGHGVPGAFMSMLGIGYLNEVVIEGGEFEPYEILNKVRAKIIKALTQTEGADQRKDGMDISLCVLDKASNKVKFTGANNPLYLVRQDEGDKNVTIEKAKMLEGESYILYDIKADKMPVGKHILDQESFTQVEFDLMEGDVLYSFSDGFQDQFGGPDGKKFMAKRVKKMLLTLQDKSLKAQHEILEKAFDDWISEGGTKQIDDVCFVGVKF